RTSGEKRVFLVILFTSFSGSLVSRISGAVHSESGGVFLDLYLAISLEKTIPTHAVNPVITPK
ncbi:hypothetical protein, partial [Escherichia coli]|uniref:hypothetical protein n=1 Tax=Escherichia coli TaxID=562 RepID=UPI001BC8B626